jgi:hypothetical protein
MDLSDDNYNAGKATGRLSVRELSEVVESVQELENLVKAVDDAASAVAESDTVQIEDLVGLLRHEARGVETMYIRGLEQQVEKLSEVSEEQIIQKMMEMEEKDE